MFDPIGFGIFTLGAGGSRVDDNTFRNNRINGAGTNPAATPFFGFGAGLFLRR